MGFFDDIADAFRIFTPAGEKAVATTTKNVADVLTKPGGAAINAGLKVFGGGKITDHLGKNGGIPGSVAGAFDGGKNVATYIGGGDHTHNKPHKDTNGFGKRQGVATPLTDEADKQPKPPVNPAKADTEHHQKMAKKEVLDKIKIYEATFVAGNRSLNDLNLKLTRVKKAFAEIKKQVFDLEGKYKQEMKLVENKSITKYNLAIKDRRVLPPYSKSNYTLIRTKQIKDWNRMRNTMIQYLAQINTYKTFKTKKDLLIKTLIGLDKTKSDTILRAMADTEIEKLIEDFKTDVKKMKTRAEEADKMRLADKYPGISLFWKDFFTGKKYEKYENGKGKPKWKKLAKEMKMPLDDLVKKYKRSLLSIILEKRLKAWLKKDKAGKYVDGPDKDFKPKMMALIQKVREMDARNKNWFQLIFFKEQRNNDKYKTGFKDSSASEQLKRDTVKLTDGPARAHRWFYDQTFYITPKKFAKNSQYVNDAMVANVSYMAPSKRINLISYKYREPMILGDAKFYPHKQYMRDVCIYYTKTTAWIGFKGTTKTSVSDWHDNLMNVLNKHKETHQWKAHVEIYNNVKRLLPGRDIRVAGHSRGGFWAMELAEEFKLKGSSFTGATSMKDFVDLHLNVDNPGLKNFFFYVSSGFDVVSNLRKSDQKNHVRVVQTIPGLGVHDMLNYVPRIYWTPMDIKNYDSKVQTAYVQYLIKVKRLTSQTTTTSAPKTNHDLLIRAAKVVALGMMTQYAIGGAIAKMFEQSVSRTMAKAFIAFGSAYKAEEALEKNAQEQRDKAKASKDDDDGAPSDTAKGDDDTYMRFKKPQK